MPLVVLSTSGAERDVAETHGLHANAYVVRLVDLDRFVQIAHAVKEFWFSAARLPSWGEGSAAEPLRRGGRKSVRQWDKIR